MKKTIVHNTISQSIVNNPAFSNIFPGKPVIIFDTELKIIECSEEFVALALISHSDLLKVDISKHASNQQFTAAAIHAFTKGVGSFEGMLFMGDDLGSLYLNVVFLLVGTDHQQASYLSCVVLNSKSTLLRRIRI